MKKLLFNLVLIITLIYTHSFPQQYEEFICPDVEIASEAIEAQEGGLFKPSQNAPEEYFRVLFVFVEFANDTNNYSLWQSGQLPTYAYNLVDSLPSSNYRSFTMSDYWKVMSRGNFDFIGDVYPNLITLNSKEYYQNNNYSWYQINQMVFDSINGKIDFWRYDNWYLDESTGAFVFNERNGDGYLDMLYIIYREPEKVWFGNFDGIAVLGYSGYYTTSSGVRIGCNWLSHLSSGITMRRGANTSFYGLLSMLNHEFGHYLFGAGHTQMGGIMNGRSETNTFALSGYESERLGYSAFSVANQNNYTITMGDFISDGHLLKIPISTNKCFIVENHQRLSKYDQIMRGGVLQGNFDTSTTLGKGIYIWLVQNPDYYPATIDVKTANGNWNWVLVDSIAMPEGWPAWMPLTGRSAVNRNTGKSDRHPDNIEWRDKVWAKWHDTIPLTKQNDLTRNVMGLETQAFNYNYNRLFTPWSSPSTYSDGITNIALQVYSENGNNVTLKVFNTYASCLALPPSKPQFLRVSAVNGSAKLDWDPNIEPDMWNGHYKIYRTSTLGTEPTSFTHIATISAYSGRTPVSSWTDPDPASVGSGGLKLFYKISARDSSGLESLLSDYDWVPWNGNMQKPGHDNDQLITEYRLYDNYPNPFNPSTTIKYDVKEKGYVQLKIFDVLGKEVASLVEKDHEPGSYEATFDASKLTSGIYMYKLTAGSFTSIKKMMLLK